MISLPVPQQLDAVSIAFLEDTIGNLLHQWESLDLAIILFGSTARGEERSLYDSIS